MSGGDSDCRCRTQCVQEIGRKRAKILVKYDDALGRRAKVMIGKSQDRLHRHGIFSTSGPDRPSLAKALSRGQVLWCLTRQDLFAPALAQVGLMPDRVIYVEAGDEKAVLICFEEGLRHRGLGAVVAEVARLSMTASRRL